MQTNRGGFLNRCGKAVTFLLSCIVVFALHCKFEISSGGFPDSVLLGSLNKLYDSFTPISYTDLVILFAVWKLFDHVFSREHKIDYGTGIFALILSVLLVTCISFYKFNSPVFVLGSGFQMMLSALCICGFWILIYLSVRSLFFCMEKGDGSCAEKGGTKTFYEKHFLLFGALIIFMGWLPWILMNYPGTSCPDGMYQLSQFLGDAAWAGGHPPLSSVIMGSLFSFGRWLADANFGFFLYCFFQTCVGAWVFAYSIKKLLDLGIPAKWCTVGILFFAFSPFWGTYAQWFEKDLFYVEMTLLQAVFVLEVIIKKSCGVRESVLLVLSSILVSLLRNNGIYAVAPALLLLAVWLKKKDRKRVLIALFVTVLAFEGVTKGLYYTVLDVARPSAAEPLSIPFLQTARYVEYYGDEVTEYEREVIDRVLSFEGIANYNPLDAETVRGYYKGAELGEYFKIWFQMFWKHPGCYVSAFLNTGYGYLAPVSQDIEAWIGPDYYSYDAELGIHHVFDLKMTNVLIQVWFLSMTLPLVKYLCTPGMYTWILLVLALFLWKRRKFGGLILFVPSIMDVLVCVASPLPSALRFEMPVAAALPLLIGWTYYCLHEDEGREGG